MGAAHHEREGILILRAWTERNQVGAARIRIIRVVDRTDLPATTVTSVDEACVIVRRWLDEMLGQDQARGSLT